VQPVDAERRESVDWTRLVQQVVAYQRVRRQRVPTTRYDTIRSWDGRPHKWGQQNSNWLE